MPRMDTYDYAIVGAGSAGCVLANRLSADPDTRVLLLEAGPGNAHPLLHIPAGWATNFRNPRVDWGFSTEPEPALNGRSIYWPRGKVLGGSSAINGMIYVRGVPLDFDRWAQSGARGWSYEEVLPYFRRAERQQRVQDEFHGAHGPLHVQDVRDKRPAMDAFIDGMVELGIPRNDDFNGQDAGGRRLLPVQPAPGPPLERGNRLPEPGEAPAQPRGHDRRPGQASVLRGQRGHGS